jgi:glycosyltransferase involved in cell wall biosynthesis
MSGTIIYVGAFELPDRNAAAQRARANAQIFAQLDFKTICVGVSPEVSEGRLSPLAAESNDTIEYWNRSLPQSGAAWFRRVVSVADLEPLVAANAHDLVAVIGYDFPAVSLARLKAIAHRYGAVAIGESTEWYANSGFTSISGIARTVDKSLRMRLQNRRMDGLIVASSFLKDYYANRGQPVVELPTLMPDVRTREASRRQGRGAGPVRLLFAGGGFDPHLIGTDRERLKDRLDHVIEALAIAAKHGGDFILDVFGVDQDTYLRIVPAHKGLIGDDPDRFRFHGKRPRKDVLSALEQADFSIFLRKPTRVTLAGFPTKYGESIHHGTPVITNNVGSLAQYHVEGKTGHFIVYGDAKRAGEELLAILAQDEVSVAKMADFCEQSGLFSPAHHVKAVGQFIAEVRKRHDVLPR